MRRIAIAFLVLSASFSHALSYKIVNHMTIGSQKYTDSIILDQGKQATVSAINSETKNGYRTEVTASPIAADGNSPVKLKYKVFSVTKGKEKLVSTPEIIAALGEEALIEIGTKDSADVFKLSVIVDKNAE